MNLERSTNTPLLALVEKGFSPDAVAGYGTSVEVLKNALAKGTLDPYPRIKCQLEYQKDALGNGGYLYYALPFIQNAPPSVADMVIANFHPMTPDQARNELDTQKTIDTLQHYAFYQAVRDSFNTGLRHALSYDQIVGLAVLNGCMNHDTAPFETAYYEACVASEDPSLFALQQTLEIHMGKEGLRTQLQSAIERRGVMLFFNQSLFESTAVYPGYEAEGEIYVVSQKEFPLSVLSGIQCNAQSDYDVLFGARNS